MADDIQQILLRYKVDQQAVQQALSANELVAKKLVRLGVEGELSAKKLDRLKKNMVGLTGDELDEARLQAAKFEEKIAKAADETDRLVKSLADAGNQKLSVPTLTGAQEADERFGKVSQEVGLFGDVETGLRTVGVEGAVPEIFAVAEALPRLKVGLEGLPAQATAAAQALGPAGVALAGLAVGVVAGLSVLNAGLAETKRQLAAATEANKQYYQLLGSGATTEDVEAQLERARQQLQAEQAELASIEGSFASGFQSTASAVGDAGARILYALGQVSDADDDLVARADELRTSTSASAAEVQRLEQALASGAFAANDAAKAEKELAEARAAAAKAVIARAISAETEAAQLMATGTSEALQSRIQSLEIERKVLRDNLAAAQKLAEETGDTSQVDQMVSRLAEIDTAMMTFATQGVAEAIAAREAEEEAAEKAKQKTENLAKAVETLQAAEEKAAEAATDHQDKLAEIEAAGADRLVQIKEAGAERLAAAEERINDTRAKLAEVDTKLRGSIADVNKKFMQSELEAVRKFRLEEARETARANRERLRRLQDLEDDLYDAQQANDVNAFIAAERAGEKDLQRMAEDADEQTLLRQEQFAEERRLAEQQRAERIADLQVQAEERRAALQQQLADEQAARDKVIAETQKQLAVEQDRIAKAIQAEDQRFAKYIDNLNKQTAEERRLTESVWNAALSSGQRTWSGIESAAINTGKKIESFFSGLFSSSSSPNASGSNISSLNYGGGVKRDRIAFASGGIATRPTLGMMAERPGWHEAAIPFRPSEGIESALGRLGLGGGGPTVNVSLGNVNLGGISKAEFDAGIEALGRKILTGIDMGVMGYG